MFAIIQITRSPKTLISLVGKEGYEVEILWLAITIAWLMVCILSDLNLRGPSVAALGKMMKLIFTLPGM